MKRGTLAFIVPLIAQLMAAQAYELRSVNQMPALISQAPDGVTIANVGASTLSFLYWDGTWNSVQVSSGQYAVIPTPSSGLSVRYNDGVETQSVVLAQGYTRSM